MTSAFAKILAAAALLVATPACQPRQTDRRVSASILLATNESRPASPPPKASPYAPKIERIFGYNQIRLLGEQRGKLSASEERWLIPGSEFSILVSEKESTPTGSSIFLQLFPGKYLLVRTEALMKTRSPLLIKGPLYGSGQLIIVIEID